jgi:hypothetical protein
MQRQALGLRTSFRAERHAWATAAEDAIHLRVSAVPDKVNARTHGEREEAISINIDAIKLILGATVPK